MNIAFKLLCNEEYRKGFEEGFRIGRVSYCREVVYYFLGRRKEESTKRVSYCREVVYYFLTSRFDGCPENVCVLIDACDDLAILDELLHAAYICATLDDFVDKVDALLDPKRTTN